jgi:GNAT superfamily N-acetyltransferase
MQIRAADANDSSRCAEIHVLARRLMSYLPETHTPAEVQAWKRYLVFPQQTVWIAEIDRENVGYASLEGRDLTNRYVHPDYQCRGAGSALLAQVQSIASEGIQLWTFQPKFVSWKHQPCAESTDKSTKLRKSVNRRAVTIGCLRAFTFLRVGQGLRENQRHQLPDLDSTKRRRNPLLRAKWIPHSEDHRRL